MAPDQRLRAALRNIFGWTDFRPGQREAAQALLRHRDTVCLMPTGGGKSLCWQLPAAVHTGWTLVVSPLIALMRDQAGSLTAKGIPARCMDSAQSREERAAALDAMRRGQGKILMVSPERLQSAEFRGLCAERPPWLVVVDEAHCVPRWGEHFRPAYGQIGGFIASLPARPVLCAMTATADRAMLRDIAASLGLRRPRTVTLPVVRDNLALRVRTTLQPEADMIGRVAACREGKCLIFCRTRARTEWLAQRLRGAGLPALHYHAGMEPEDRMAAQERFASGEVRVMSATTAFGMGVDIPDIRLVIHDGLPDSLVDYAQQAGRAGRDGLPADCLLLLDPAGLERRRRLLRRQKKRLFQASWQEIRRARQTRREVQALLDWCLNGRCLWTGIARMMGQRAHSCGHCGACERAQRHGGHFVPLTSTPPLAAMEPWQLRRWALRWQRAELARQRGCAPTRLVTEAQLNRMARMGSIPSDMTLPEDAAEPFRRLLAHMRV